MTKLRESRTHLCGAVTFCHFGLLANAFGAVCRAAPKLREGGCGALAISWTVPPTIRKHFVFFVYFCSSLFAFQQKETEETKDRRPANHAKGREKNFALD